MVAQGRLCPPYGNGYHDSRHNAAATRGSQPAELAGKTVRLQAVPDRGLSDAGDWTVAGVSHLSARTRRLARVHRYHYRSPWRFCRAGELSIPAERPLVVGRGVLQRVLYGGGDVRE